MDKTYRTALVWIPPEADWEPIQQIRRRLDPKVSRWMPHVTLLYPFWRSNRFDLAVEQVRSVLEGFDPFTTRLATFHAFRHRQGRATLWLAPEPLDPWRALHRRLQRAFPECDDVARFARGFTPHLSVGRAQGPGEPDVTLSALQRDWTPIESPVASVFLLERGEHTPFEVAAEVGVGV